MIVLRDDFYFREIIDDQNQLIMNWARLFVEFVYFICFFDMARGFRSLLFN